MQVSGRTDGGTTAVEPAAGPDMLQMTRVQRLRRVVLLCCHFGRNLAYYRAGWLGGSLVRDSDFWKTVNGNFLDLAVLEWCKLLGDEKANHYWRKIVSAPSKFEAGLLACLDLTVNNLKAYRIEMRSYRDRFVAHLDLDFTMHIPNLHVAKAAVEYYHSHVVEHELGPGDLTGLPTSFSDYYHQCSSEGARVYGG